MNKVPPLPFPIRSARPEPAPAPGPVKKLPEVLAVVMARAGSKGLPGKALRPLLGRPVIAWTFDAARATRYVTRVVVSSDDPQVLQLATAEGIMALDRPPELATDTAATDAVLRHVVATLKQTEGYEPDAVVMLYGNVPIRRKIMIDRCIHLLRWHDCDSVQTVASVGKYHPFWMFSVEGNLGGGKISKYQPNDVYRRQDLPPLFMPTGAVYVMKTTVLMAAEGASDPHAFLGADRRALLTEPDDSVDIDTARDLALAEIMLREEQAERAAEAPTETGDI